jgi:hypothetical protein
MKMKNYRATALSIVASVLLSGMATAQNCSPTNDDQNVVVQGFAADQDGDQNADADQDQDTNADQDGPNQDGTGQDATAQQLGQLAGQTLGLLMRNRSSNQGTQVQNAAHFSSTKCVGKKCS